MSIESITVTWPSSNGDLKSVKLTDEDGGFTETLWSGSEAPTEFTIPDNFLSFVGIINPFGNYIFRFDFAKKVSNEDFEYTILVEFDDGTFLDLIVNEG